MMVFCGFGPMPVGDQETVAEVFEDWVNNGDVDGFNVAFEFTFLQIII
jgi:alkanesulfonate monooxygenase SsuD/methylene tetrahydromethanopterin reductase-like flavin-dependent oxidoreductase (luciferase family)